MNPKVGVSLVGLSLALAAMAQVENNTTNDHGFEHGRIGGPYTTQDRKPETTESAAPYTGDNNTNATHGFGPDGRTGGPYTESKKATATHGLAPTSHVGGPLTSVIPYSITSAPVADATEANDFECGIHELTSKDLIPTTPIASPTSKHVSELTKLMDPTWSNATETAILSINPITPTGAQQTPIPGTSPVYTTLVPGASKNWNGTDAEVPPTGTHAMVTVQSLDGSSSVEASRTPVPNPNAHDHDESDASEEGQAGKFAVSVGAIVAAALVAYGI